MKRLPLLLNHQYLESLDPVRPVKHGLSALAHARMEVLIALLFGEHIVVPEPVSFDSAAFLEISSDLLGEPEDHCAARDAFWKWCPFTFVGRGESRGFRTSLARLLRNPNFILSAWPTITDDGQVREAIANDLEAGAFSAAARHARFRGVKKNVDAVAKLDGYFRLRKPCRANDPPMGLGEFETWLESAEIPAPVSHAGFAGQFETLKQGMRVLRRAGVDAANRSHVREQGGSYLAPPVHEALIEFIDSAYNEVVHSSTRAAWGTFSTPLGSESPLINTAQAAARHATDSLLPQRAQRSGRQLVFQFSAGLEPEEYRFVRKVDLWGIMGDGEWRRSVRRLRQALDGATSAHDARLLEAREAHSDLVARFLGTLRFESHKGWRYILPVASSAVALAGISHVALYAIQELAGATESLSPLGQGIFDIGASLGLEKPAERAKLALNIVLERRCARGYARGLHKAVQLL